MSHTLTVPSSLPVTIHLPGAEYCNAVTLPVCPSKFMIGVLDSDGMSHILYVSYKCDSCVAHLTAVLPTELPAAARYILSGLMARRLTCF